MTSSLLSRFRVRHAETRAGTGKQPAQSRDPSSANLGNGDDAGEEGGTEAGDTVFNPGQRRARSDSLGQDLDDSELEAHRERKRQKVFATTLCIAKGLPEGALDHLIGMRLVDLVISLQAEVIGMQMRERKSAAQEFIESEDFKDIVKDRLRACLLSPNLTVYVLGLGDQIFAFAKKNLQIFKIPEAALDDPEMSGKIIFLIKDQLTSLRSNMKQKLNNHINNKSHISVLAKSLAPGGGFEITTAHWARVAFLRDSLVEFASVVEESRIRARTRVDSPSQFNDDSDQEETQNSANAMKNKVWVHSDFWEYIDHILRELRSEAREAEVTPAARAKHVEMFFTRCLQADTQNFPGTISSPATPAFDKVTVPWQKLIYTRFGRF